MTLINILFFGSFGYCYYSIIYGSMMQSIRIEHPTTGCHVPVQGAPGMDGGIPRSIPNHARRLCHILPPGTDSVEPPQDAPLLGRHGSIYHGPTLPFVGTRVLFHEFPRCSDIICSAVLLGVHGGSRFVSFSSRQKGKT